MKESCRWSSFHWYIPSTYVRLACERRRISSCRLSRRNQWQPEIHLRSQANMRYYHNNVSGLACFYCDSLHRSFIHFVWNSQHLCCWRLLLLRLLSAFPWKYIWCSHQTDAATTTDTVVNSASANCFIVTFRTGTTRNICLLLLLKLLSPACLWFHPHPRI